MGRHQVLGALTFDCFPSQLIDAASTLVKDRGHGAILHHNPPLYAHADARRPGQEAADRHDDAGSGREFHTLRAGLGRPLYDRLEVVGPVPGGSSGRPRRVKAGPVGRLPSPRHGAAGAGDPPRQHRYHLRSTVAQVRPADPCGHRRAHRDAVRSHAAGAHHGALPQALGVNGAEAHQARPRPAP
jgi:hypothetical protein